MYTLKDPLSKAPCLLAMPGPCPWILQALEWIYHPNNEVRVESYYNHQWPDPDRQVHVHVQVVQQRQTTIINSIWQKFHDFWPPEICSDK